MMKSYIIAATSISCILSNVNIANAGINERNCNAIAIETRGVGRTLYCNPSELDIKDIYNVVTEEYKKINNNSFKSETDQVSAYEAKSVVLTEMTIISNGAKTAQVEIPQIKRFYSKTRLVDKNLKIYFQYKLLSEFNTIRKGKITYDWESKKWISGGLGEMELPNGKN